MTSSLRRSICITNLRRVGTYKTSSKGELMLCCLNKLKRHVLFEIPTLIQHSSLIKVWIHWLAAWFLQLPFWAFVNILSQNLKRSQPQNPRAFTQTLIAPKLTLKIPTETWIRWRGGAYHRFRYLPPTGQKIAIKSCGQKETTIAGRKHFFIPPPSLWKA